MTLGAKLDGKLSYTIYVVLCCYLALSKYAIKNNLFSWIKEEEIMYVSTEKKLVSFKLQNTVKSRVLTSLV